jgi:hypothetical protein
MLKDYRYWIAFGQFLQDVGKPLECPHNTYQPIREKAELLSCYQQKRGHFQPVSLKRPFSVHLSKSKELGKIL